MNRALCWKEWREHRLIWLAVAVLAVVVVGGAYFTLAPAGAASLARDEGLQTLLLATLLVLAVAYALVCAGMMFAGEREAGTQVFLDMLAGQRLTIWRTKAVVGAVLSVAQALLLLALGLALGLFRDPSSFWSWCLFLVLFSLCTFGWGLVASALGRTALGAAGLGALLLFASWGVVIVVAWLVAVFQGATWTLAPAEAVLTLGGLILARRIYCHPDRQRRLDHAKAARKASRSPVIAYTALWLAAKQGRPLLTALAVGGPLFGALVPLGGTVLWPVGTLLVGVLCGSAVFAGEQSGTSYRFLADQRLPLGRIWTGKTLFWLAVAAGVSFLVFLGALLHALIADWHHLDSLVPGTTLTDWLRKERILSLNMAPLPFLTFWVLNGFCAAVLLTQLFRKTVIALPMALLLAAGMGGIWVPSLVMGGTLFWQLLGVPVLLLVTSRLFMWPWVHGRLYTRRSLVGLAGCGLLALTWTAGGLWYRVAEVPDVGEPFDLRLYTASLSRPEDNELRQLILRAQEELADQEKRFPFQIAAKKQLKPDAPAQPPGYLDLYYILNEILEKGWPPTNPEVAPWLAKMCQGKWVEDYRKAADLPLGTLADPRTSYAYRASPLHATGEAAKLLSVCALQMQAQGRPGESLDNLVVVLGLSRQVCFNAPSRICWFDGWGMEASALEGLNKWLHYVGPQKDLLRRALHELARHEAETPSLVGSIKADYFVTRDRLAELGEFGYRSGQNELPEERALFSFAFAAPWEKERLRRLINAITTGQLALARRPLWDRHPAAYRAAMPGDNDYELLASEQGLDVAEITAQAQSPRQWGKLLFRARMEYFLSSSYRFVHSAALHQCQIRAARLQIALALYQLQHGRPAGSLKELTPGILTDVPVDPFTGKSFPYRVSKGERLSHEGGFLDVQPGQGVLWCAGQRDHFYLVPMWPKR
jgi:hypothetical protein